MSRYVLSRLADRDLNEIWEFIADRDGIDRADGVVADLEDALRFLTENPNAGHCREDLAPRSHRFWSVHEILVIYLADTTPLQVVRFWHAKRDRPDRV